MGRHRKALAGQQEWGWGICISVHFPLPRGCVLPHRPSVPARQPSPIAVGSTLQGSENHSHPLLLPLWPTLIITSCCYQSWALHCPFVVSHNLAHNVVNKLFIEHCSTPISMCHLSPARILTYPVSYIFRRTPSLSTRTICHFFVYFFPIRRKYLLD